MKAIWPVLFGLVLAMAGMSVCSYLGTLLDRPPDWRTGIMVLLLLVTTQWLSFLMFRHQIALQVFGGLILCMAIGLGLLYSGIPMFWEHEDSPLSGYPITWRSDIAFLLLMAVTQGASLLIFRHLRLGKWNSKAGSQH